MQNKKLTHIDEYGQACMVDISHKSVSERKAVASCTITALPETVRLILAGKNKKGDVLATARIAGIMAAKKTHHLIPMCHSLQLSVIKIDFNLPPIPNKTQLQNVPLVEIFIQATCKINSSTGVEMEALTAVSISALTIYDMCKAIDREMCIKDIRLVHKSGGKSGAFDRD